MRRWWRTRSGWEPRCQANNCGQGTSTPSPTSSPPSKALPSCVRRRQAAGCGCGRCVFWGCVSRRHCRRRRTGSRSWRRSCVLRWQRRHSGGSWRRWSARTPTSASSRTQSSSAAAPPSRQSSPTARTLPTWPPCSVAWSWSGRSSRPGTASASRRTRVCSASSASSRPTASTPRSSSAPLPAPPSLPPRSHAKLSGRHPTARKRERGRRGRPREETRSGASRVVSEVVDFWE
mmetsp:Transcript_12275/g.25231  ORF Transcript_12275/g.25231 Transcript_12275/m.25231 type:complete len:233 (-) Transcript_12275:30-728(-)